MKLNIGAGGRRIEGYTGVDVTARPGADIVAPAHAIPLPDGSCDEIMAIHLIEHLLPWVLPKALAEWARLMKPGGHLVIEAPDLMKCCQNIIDGYQKGGKHPDQMGLWGIFGDDRTQDKYMLHRYAYTFATLRPLVESAGFVKPVECQTVYHPVGRHHRDFRLEASKPVNA